MSEKTLTMMRCPGCGYLMAKKQWDALYTRDIPCPNKYPGLDKKEDEFPVNIRPGCAWLVNRFGRPEYTLAEYMEVPND